MGFSVPGGGEVFNLDPHPRGLKHHTGTALLTDTSFLLGQPGQGVLQYHPLLLL